MFAIYEKRRKNKDKNDKNDKVVKPVDSLVNLVMKPPNNSFLFDCIKNKELREKHFNVHFEILKNIFDNIEVSRDNPRTLTFIFF